MTRCNDKRCVTFREDSLQTAWEDIRYVFGPRIDWSTEVGSKAYEDVALWTEWANANGYSPSDPSRFGRWLIWKCRFGTNNYGNLPSRTSVEHEGISCIPCPYDTGAEALKTQVWLTDDDPDLTAVDHGDYYIRVASRGVRWGFECTYSGCPYRIYTGRPYFYV